MVGAEINMVVRDSLQALALYESIFEVERLEVTNYESGLNEAIFSIYGLRFHLLDENPDYSLVAPKAGEVKSFWVNFLVPDIQETYAKALAAGCQEIQPITRVEEMGVSNAIFSDPFGYIWLIHQVHCPVSFEERCEFFEKQMQGKS
ncbi:MAG: VOC family protein [Firmicutes bacterium]|nr:VOC family protein [Bacillota bacterium]